MLAIRCKPRWPGAVAAVRVGSPFRARARCLGTATATATETETAAETATASATATAEGGRDAGEKGADHGSSRARLMLPRHKSRSPYVPRAYESEPMSYLDLIRRTTAYLRWRTRQAIAVPRRELLRGGRSHTDGASVPSAEPSPSPSPSPSLEQVLDRAAYFLDLVSEEMKPILSAVSEDIASHLVPKGYTQDPATLRSHHLGRWYAGSMWLQYEHRQITVYLRNVAADTERARRYITSIFIRTAQEALRVQRIAGRRAVEDYQSAFEAIAYTMIHELKVARLDGQWHRVWTLERRLALTTSMFLPSRPLALTYHELRHSDSRKIIEISMSRMAEWQDSYKSLYSEDAQSRSHMNLANRYRTIFNTPIYERPWNGESRICPVRSPTRTDREFIVLRLDQGSIPSPLWPRAWRPVWQRIWHANTEAGSEPEPKESTRKMKWRTVLTTSPGTERKWKRKGKTTKDPKSQRLEQPSLDTHASPDVPEAWYGALLSDE